VAIEEDITRSNFYMCLSDMEHTKNSMLGTAKKTSSMIKISYGKTVNMDPVPAPRLAHSFAPCGPPMTPKFALIAPAFRKNHPSTIQVRSTYKCDMTSLDPDTPNKQSQTVLIKRNNGFNNMKENSIPRWIKDSPNTEEMEKGSKRKSMREKTSSGDVLRMTVLTKQFQQKVASQSDSNDSMSTVASRPIRKTRKMRDTELKRRIAKTRSCSPNFSSDTEDSIVVAPKKRTKKAKLEPTNSINHYGNESQTVRTSKRRGRPKKFYDEVEDVVVKKPKETVQNKNIKVVTSTPTLKRRQRSIAPPETILDDSIDIQIGTKRKHRKTSDKKNEEVTTKKTSDKKNEEVVAKKRRAGSILLNESQSESCIQTSKRRRKKRVTFGKEESLIYESQNELSEGYQHTADFLVNETNATTFFNHTLNDNTVSLEANEEAIKSLPSTITESSVCEVLHEKGGASTDLLADNITTTASATDVTSQEDVQLAVIEETVTVDDQLESRMPPKKRRSKRGTQDNEKNLHIVKELEPTVQKVDDDNVPSVVNISKKGTRNKKEDNTTLKDVDDEMENGFPEQGNEAMITSPVVVALYSETETVIIASSAEDTVVDQNRLDPPGTDDCHNIITANEVPMVRGRSKRRGRRNVSKPAAKKLSTEQILNKLHNEDASLPEPVVVDIAERVPLEINHSTVNCPDASLTTEIVNNEKHRAEEELELSIVRMEFENAEVPQHFIVEESVCTETIEIVGSEANTYNTNDVTEIMNDLENEPPAKDNVHAVVPELIEADVVKKKKKRPAQSVHRDIERVLADDSSNSSGTPVRSPIESTQEEVKSPQKAMTVNSNEEDPLMAAMEKLLQEKPLETPAQSLKSILENTEKPPSFRNLSKSGHSLSQKQACRKIGLSKKVPVVKSQKNNITPSKVCLGKTHISNNKDDQKMEACDRFPAGSEVLQADAPNTFKHSKKKLDLNLEHLCQKQEPYSTSVSNGLQNTRPSPENSNKDKADINCRRLSVSIERLPVAPLNDVNVKKSKSHDRHHGESKKKHNSHKEEREKDRSKHRHSKLDKSILSEGRPKSKGHSKDHEKHSDSVTKEKNNKKPSEKTTDRSDGKHFPSPTKLHLKSDVDKSSEILEKKVKPMEEKSAVTPIPPLRRISSTLSLPSSNVVNSTPKDCKSNTIVGLVDMFGGLASVPIIKKKEPKPAVKKPNRVVVPSIFFPHPDPPSRPQPAKPSVSISIVYCWSVRLRRLRVAMVPRAGPKKSLSVLLGCAMASIGF